MDPTLPGSPRTPRRTHGLTAALRDTSERKCKAATERNAQSESARWRAEPATEVQWRVLQCIERETGQTLADSMTKGEASDLIGARLPQDEHAACAHH